ncbi:hypothetical protein NQZ68_018893 [Dissostichus eleginoides]|nr:hypothetical protein NQZ68_018893 [Dissostichus eleginoides]
MRPAEAALRRTQRLSGPGEFPSPRRKKVILQRGGLVNKATPDPALHCPAGSSRCNNQMPPTES